MFQESGYDVDGVRVTIGVTVNVDVSIAFYSKFLLQHIRPQAKFQILL